MKITSRFFFFFFVLFLVLHSRVCDKPKHHFHSRTITSTRSCSSCFWSRVLIGSLSSILIGQNIILAQIKGCFTRATQIQMVWNCKQRSHVARTQTQDSSWWTRRTSSWFQTLFSLIFPLMMPCLCRRDARKINTFGISCFYFSRKRSFRLLFLRVGIVDL